MSRPKKCRKVCRFPSVQTFFPVDSDPEKSAVVLTVDEYETIRLIDREGMSQEQCGQYMGVARTTIQQIYATARKKLADMLVEGLCLKIEGGNYQLCHGEKGLYSCGGCLKYRIHQKYIKPKGEHVMRIAVTFQNGLIFQHFGHTKEFKIYDVENGKIIASKVVDTQGSGHGALVDVLSALSVDILICGGIGGGARAALDAADIQLYGGVVGKADQAVQDWMEGTLSFNPDIQCAHHEGRHSVGECGKHGCGNHSFGPEA